MSKVSSLNDPFEFAYLPSPTFSQRALEKSTKEILRAPNFLKYAKALIPTISRRGLNRLHESEKTKLVESLKQHYAQYDPVGSGDAMECADKTVRICCFTSDKVTPDDEILMWSHYAKKHQGFRVEFELDDYILQEVQYSKERVPVTIHKKSNRSEILRSICTKAKGWEYEHEFRLIVDVDRCRHSPEGFSFSGFSPNDITGIDFGIKCLPTEIEKISSEVNENYRHVKLRKAERDLKKYQINYVSC